jgi:hypothetical protein
MRKWILLSALSCTFALASDTVTRNSRSGSRCATSTLEGAISKVDIDQKTFGVKGAKASREFKVTPDTLFRIPGATQQQLKDAPLSKVTPNARVKVFYCTKDGTPVEVKIER